MNLLEEYLIVTEHRGNRDSVGLAVKRSELTLLETPVRERAGDEQK